MEAKQGKMNFVVWFYWGLRLEQASPLTFLTLLLVVVYIHATARLACNALYSLGDDAPDDGLVIVRNV